MYQYGWFSPNGENVNFGILSNLTFHSLVKKPNSLSLSSKLLPSPSSWQEVGRRLAFLPTMRWRWGWKGHLGRAIFWKINFWRAFCDQNITLCAGHRRPSSETKVTSCNSLSFRDFTAILFHVLHFNKQCIPSPCLQLSTVTAKDILLV